MTMGIASLKMLPFFFLVQLPTLEQMKLFVLNQKLKQHEQENFLEILGQHEGVLVVQVNEEQNDKIQEISP